MVAGVVGVSLPASGVLFQVVDAGIPGTRAGILIYPHVVGKTSSVKPVTLTELPEPRNTTLAVPAPIAPALPQALDWRE